MTSHRDRYHHGALREALVSSGIELARQGGPERVILREVSRLAGVSHAAAYRHFADRDSLVAEIAAHARAQLAAAMRARIAAVADPRERLRQVGSAYIDFALTDNGLFRIAFAAHPHLPGGADSGGEPGVVAPPDTDRLDDPYAVLTEVLDSAASAGLLSAGRRSGAEIAAWSAVHGLAELLTSGPLAGDPARTAAAIRRVLDAIDDALFTPA